jgi:hypothetical protein
MAHFFAATKLGHTYALYQYGKNEWHSDKFIPMANNQL